MPSRNPNVAENLKPFTKGKSGNYKGRPKGIVNRSTVVKHWLLTRTEYTNPLTGETYYLEILDQMVLAMIQRALLGDVQAFRELMDSAYGKVADQVNSVHNFLQGPVHLEFKSQGEDFEILS